MNYSDWRIDCCRRISSLLRIKKGRHRAIPNETQSANREDQSDLALYECLARLHESPNYKQLFKNEEEDSFFIATAFLSKRVFLPLTVTSIILFIVSFAFLSSGGRLGLFLLILILIILLEISVICNIARSQMKSGYYKLLGTTKSDIERREERIQIIGAFPTGSLKRVLRHLKYDITSRKSYLHFILGGSINLGIFPAVFAIYVAFRRLTSDDTYPDYIVPMFLAIVLGLGIMALQFSSEIRRLELMTHCLECAINRAKASKAGQEVE